jgi:hypothetical protein
MWEARAAAGCIDELVAYVLEHADPAAQVYRSAGDDVRVVVIDPTGRGMAAVPAELLARPAHTWEFERLPRGRT